ncbi:hypothetical protein HMPREF0973_02957 [Prevotella veroralis F0319]|uniref:Uncharacterized protein n=1 Tax=Prevotella veroralis F0319 TaxID=649761 RepID=C9MTI1_9BACT|nr:hypothetical protein HMPREF0973_02957 [Prevotella veroralis F0319]
MNEAICHSRDRRPRLSAKTPLFIKGLHIIPRTDEGVRPYFVSCYENI